MYGLNGDAFPIGLETRSLSMHTKSRIVLLLLSFFRFFSRLAGCGWCCWYFSVFIVFIAVFSVASFIGWHEIVPVIWVYT